MKLTDLQESVTFSAVELQTDDKGRKVYRWMETPVEKECWVCDGTGTYYGKEGDCEYCHGKKVYTDYENQSPELNVANANARLIADMLELDSEDGMGAVEHKDIPAVLRKLMLLKNTGKAAEFVRPDQTHKGPTRVDRSGEHPTITRGPTIHDMGVDAQRIGQYLDRLIAIFKFAQDNNLCVSWA